MANLEVIFEQNDILIIGSEKYPLECFIIPRKSMSTALPCYKNDMALYFLIDSKEGKKEKRKLYVGQTSNGLMRFIEHKSSKDWWDKAILFTPTSRFFKEDTLGSLEKILIERYKRSNLYDINQNGSNKKVTDNSETLCEQITNIMDFLGYPSINEIEVNNTEDSNVVDFQYDSNELFKKLDKSINQLSNKIRYDQLKLYRAYRLCDNNICAVWVRSNTIEIELYINKKDLIEY